MKRSILSGTAIVLLLAPPAPALARDPSTMSDPCTEYEINTQLESLMADGFGRVCGLIGHSRVTGDCMNYYLRITADGAMMPLSDAARAKLADACEASQPGGTMLGHSDCGGEAECLPADVEPTADGPGAMEPDGAMGCGEGALECVEPDWAEEPVDDGGVAVMEPDGAIGCGEGALECVEPDWAEAPVDDVSGAGAGAVGEDVAQARPASASAPDAALDLAFWNSIKDSDSPALFRAYLDQFPAGVFRPIAEVKLAELTAPAAQVPAAPDPAPVADPTDPEALYVRAEALLDLMYNLDVAGWDAAAQEPLRLLTQAAQTGHAEATLALGELVETGIGTAQDNDRAAGLYLDAARAGSTEGYFRALMVLDQIGDNTGFVSTFLDTYRAAPHTLISSLPNFSAAALGWVQGFLRAKRIYAGAIDGAFGPDSQAALDAFLTGDVAPAAAPEVPAGRDGLARALQAELARVGCYQGALDGKWGPGSAQALFAFNHWMAGTAPSDHATQQALTEVRRAPGLVCGVD